MHEFGTQTPPRTRFDDRARTALPELYIGVNVQLWQGRSPGPRIGVEATDDRTPGLAYMCHPMPLQFRERTPSVNKIQSHLSTLPHSSATLPGVTGTGS